LSDTILAGEADRGETRAQVSSRASQLGSLDAVPAGTTLTNIQTVVALERDSRSERTVLEGLTDLVSAAASSTGFIVVHLVWFAVWVGLNVFFAERFDPYPFSLLTLVVSLEAILLTGFVLISQDRMTKLADKRAHLDLQVNLLAEQELTAILRVVCRIADETGVELKGCDPNLDQLLGRTDVKVLNDELTKEMATVDRAAQAVSVDKTEPAQQQFRR
jgi:uncharacterized membrane protein